MPTMLRTRMRQVDSFNGYVVTCSTYLPPLRTSKNGRGTTCKHPATAKESRLDYVGLPYSWRHCPTKAWVAIDVDITLSRTDHKISAVETEVMLRVPSMRQRTRNQPNKVTVRAHCSQMAFGDAIQWCTNFNEHADIPQNGYGA